MKHLKYFESYDEREIWMVPTKEPDYWVAKWKIKADGVLNQLVFGKDEADWILLHYEDEYDGGRKNDSNWTWSNIGARDDMGEKYLNSYYFKGKVYVTDEDIEIYNLSKNKEFKQFNL